MAKVDGPLMSLEARGKIADAMVFFPWKGRHVVRHWVEPTQPKSTLQGYVRAAMYAIGKVIKKIQAKAAGDSVDSKLYQLCTAKAPAGVNWNAFIAGKYLEQLIDAGNFKTANFLSYISDYSSLAGTVLTAFKTEATALALADFAFSYGYTTNIEAGCQLYFGAIAAYNGSLLASGPYTKNPKSWAVSDVTSFAKDFTTA